MKRALFICLLLAAFIAGSLAGNHLTAPAYEAVIKDYEAKWSSAQGVMAVQSGSIQYFQKQIRNLESKIADYPNPNELRDFRDLDELKQFLLDDDTDKYQYRDKKWVCSHYAFRLVENATNKGYRLYPVLVLVYRGYFAGLHMMSFAVIEDRWSGDEDSERWVVLIEPMTDQFWVFGRLYDPASWKSNNLPFDLP